METVWTTFKQCLSISVWTRARDRGVKQEDRRRRKKEEVHVSGKKEKDVAAPPTSPTPLSSPPFPPKNKARRSCSGYDPQNPFHLFPSVFLFLSRKRKNPYSGVKLQQDIQYWWRKLFSTVFGRTSSMLGKKLKIIFLNNKDVMRQSQRQNNFSTLL